MNRGALLIAGLLLAVLYSWWAARNRKQRLEAAQRYRGAAKGEDFEAGTTLDMLRQQIETRAKTSLPHLKQSDPVKELLTVRDVRDLVSWLEDEYDIILPDSQTVQALTVGKFADMVDRLRQRSEPRA